MIKIIKIKFKYKMQLKLILKDKIKDLGLLSKVLFSLQLILSLFSKKSWKY